jgi:hypothetical protein
MYVRLQVQRALLAGRCSTAVQSDAQTTKNESHEISRAVCAVVRFVLRWREVAILMRIVRPTYVSSQVQRELLAGRCYTAVQSDVQTTKNESHKISRAVCAVVRCVL